MAEKNSIQNLQFSFDIADSRQLSGTCSFAASGGEKRPAAIILHGFKGNSEWGFLPLIRKIFAENGYLAISYNHSLNGYIPGSRMLDVEKFRKMTASGQLAELALLVNSIKYNTLPDPINTEKWNGKILLCGHSMGAAIALVFAREHPDIISRLSMLAPIASFNRYYTQRQIEFWKRNGKLEFQNTRTGQNLILDAGFLNDYFANLERFDLAKAIEEVQCRILIAHGETDLTAKCAESEMLYSHADKEFTKYSVFPACNHSFNFDMEEDPEKNPALQRLLTELDEFSLL